MSPARARLPTPPKRASTLIVVPAYNEEQAVTALIGEVRHIAPDYDLVVIDDGSSDHTADAAERAGARTVRLPFNTGVGGAVRTGLRYALYHDYQRAVVVDSDGQHEPPGIHALLAALDEGADLAIGSRFAAPERPYPVPLVRRQAMRLLAWVVARVTGQMFTDVTSGFRAFDTRAIELFAFKFPSEYLADTVEVLLIAHANGLQMAEVPVAIRPRTAGVPSSRGAALLLNYLRLLVTIAMSGYRRQFRKLRKAAP